ncbi:MAG: hypothetical protein ACYDD2_00450 [Candidatus Acidiferrales bacterium]
MPELLKTATFWGFIINFMGLVVGIGGIALAVRSNQKLKSARQAKLATQKKLFSHMASDQFNSIGRIASEIAGNISTKDFVHATRLATELQLNLANAIGSWGSLFSGTETDTVDTAKRDADSLLQTLQTLGDAQVIQVETHRDMVGWSRFIMAVAGEIAGRLKVANLAEPEEEQ